MTERVDAVAEDETTGESVGKDAKAVEQALEQAAPPAVEAEAAEVEQPADAEPAEQERAAAAAVNDDTAPQAQVSSPEDSPDGEIPAEIEAEDSRPTAQAEPSEDPGSNSTERLEEPTAQATETESTETESSESESKDQSEDDDEAKRVVRTLAVGQQVTGKIKRIADFGAFVDIGVGRDGLIHISELSIRRVGKVTDVLQEGQEVTAWIKKLDRQRNRISLTLIDPETKTIRDLEKGDVVQGRVTRILPYGAFVDIGIGRDALLHVREMAEGFVAKPEDVVKVDEEIEVRIIDLSRRRSRVDLSLKGLRPEPEAAVPAQSQAAPEPEPEEETVEDAFEDMEVLSPMELAFKRAMEAEGIELSSQKKKKGKRGKRATSREIQDEIVSRTLQGRD